MTGAADTLKASLVAMSQPDADGIYRDGRGKREKRTKLVEDTLRRLWDNATDGRAVPGIGLATVGSLARGQLGPHSDLDLVIIYDPHQIDENETKRIADAIWYPLWDSGIDLDHSVRTRSQCESVTDSDLPAAMGWLDVRHIAGDARLIGETSESILTRWRKAAVKRLSELENSAHKRFNQFGNLAYLNQPDIKEARGGLRDSILVNALVASWLADRPHEIEYGECVDDLLDIRDCLQLVCGKDSNLLRTEYQSQVAVMMGFADPTLEKGEREARAVETLMTRLAHDGRHIAFAYDATMSHARHTLTHTHKRFAFFQGKRAKPKFEILEPGTAKLEGEVVLAPGVKPADTPHLELRVAVAAAENGLRIGPSTLMSLKACPISPRDWDDETRDLFLRLLATGAWLPPTWESLDYVDIPGLWIPEWLAVRNRPSVSAVHRYTIDRHMVETTAQLGDGISPHGEKYDHTHHAALLLAGILHDIGKKPGITDHAAEGVRQARAVLERMGYPEDVRDTALTLIGEHLTLSTCAMKKSPDDKDAVNALADAVGRDAVVLDMLFDLTKADSSSLGATSGELISKRQGWSEWRASLVTGMYSAARAACK